MSAVLRRTFAASLAALACACACADLPRTPRSGAETPPESQALREAELQRIWTGKPYHALLANWGAPRMIMTIPGGHRPNEMVVVYGVRNEIAGCVDAFTVHNGASTQANETSEIVNYFCR